MFFLQILLVSWVIAGACSLVGVFLVLKRMALLSDAIGHSLLLGIVLFAFLTKSLTSPLLLLGAGASGMVLVLLIELFSKTRILRGSVSMGIMYPLFFSIAVILINVFGKNIHLDTHVVVMGEIGFTVLDPWIWNGISMGPKALYVGLFFLVLNAALIFVFYKPLKVGSFDATFSMTLGLSPVLYHYLIMGMASLTAVAAFNSIGALLVIAFMIAPPASAFLLTKRMHQMIFLSLIMAFMSCTVGVTAAFVCDSSITGSIATTMGIVFIITSLFAPKEGILWKIIRHYKQKQEFLQITLLIHLMHHQNTPFETTENTFTNLTEHFQWHPALAQKIIRLTQKNHFITHHEGLLSLTSKGKQYLHSQDLV